MSSFLFDKKAEQESLALEALRKQELDKALRHLALAVEYTVELARQCEGKFKTAYLCRAAELLEIAKNVKAKLSGKSSTVQGAAGNKAAESGEPNASQLGERPQERLSDVSGMETAKDEIRFGVIEPLQNPEKTKKFGLQPGGGLLLYGLPGTGKTFFAKAVAGELGLPFYVIKSQDIFGKYVGESEAAIKKVFDDARSNPMSVIFIDETNGIMPSRSSEVHEVSKKVAEIILQETDGIDSKSKNPFLLIGATNYPGNLDDAALSRFSTIIEVELPDSKTRRFILERELRKKMEIPVADSALDAMADKTETFSCRDLVNLAHSLRKAAAKEDISEVTPEFCLRNFRDSHVVSADVAESIAEFKKRVGINDTGEKKKLIEPAGPAIAPPPGAPAPAVAPDEVDDKPVPAPASDAADEPDEPAPAALRDPAAVTFDDIKGLAEAKQIVRDSLINPVLYPTVYRTMGVRPGSGLLLYGPPGTGKTMFGRAIANELKSQFKAVTFNDVRGKNPQQTISLISSLFAAARSCPEGCVLFFDDCEELLSRSGNSKAYGVSQFLNELDGIKNTSGRVFVIIATNRPWMIDGALLRSGRISASAYIGLPELESRRALLGDALKNTPLADDVDLEKLAALTEGYSGAEIWHRSNGGGICDVARNNASRRWVERIKVDPAEEQIPERLCWQDFVDAMNDVTSAAVRDAERIRQNEEFRDLRTRAKKTDNTDDPECINGVDDADIPEEK